MKFSGPISVVAIGLGSAALAASSPDQPVDFRQRNDAFAPAPTVAPQVQVPRRADGMQDQRVSFPTVEREPAVIGDRRAAIEVVETRTKTVIGKEPHPVTVRSPDLSRLDHRPAAIQTATRFNSPDRVAKYQDSLRAASATNLRRFSTPGRQVTVDRINRFVFRRNRAEADTVPETPAAGSSGQKS